jgi:hypothetical protein
LLSATTVATAASVTAAPTPPINFGPIKDFGWLLEDAARAAAC